jgi:NAD(P)H dehydrogenase (quinone)
MKTAALRPLMEDLYQAEDYIKESGLTYTILRNSLYAGATPLYAGEKVIETGISLPTGNGKVPFALRREMGEAAANALLQNGHENQTYEITGSELYSYKTANAFSVLSERVNTDADPLTFPAKLKEFGPWKVVLLVTLFSADVKNQSENNNIWKNCWEENRSLEESLKEFASKS